MTKRSIVFLPIRLLLVTALLIAALPALFVQSAFAERVEGPLRADPQAYEHVDDDVLYAQGEGGFADGDMIAQAQGGSNIVNLGITLDQKRPCFPPGHTPTAKATPGNRPELLQNSFL